MEKLVRKEEVESLLEYLTAEEKMVLQLRFSLHDDKKYTYKEIGEKLRINSSKAREIQDRAIKKLRRIVLVNKIQ